MIDWVFPDYIFWLIALPMLWGLLLLVQARSERVFEKWFVPSQVYRHWPIVKFFVNAIAIVMIIIALLGPVFGDAKEEQDVMHREIFFLLDVSASMNARDLKPSRLEFVKQQLKQLITQYKGDRMGLILFTSHAYVQCPLTQDIQSLLLFLDMAETSQFASTGTDIRAAMLKALERFSAPTAASAAVTGKALVLITDGEHFGDNYTSVIMRLQDRGVKVFPVRVGGSHSVVVPGKFDAAGNPIYTQTHIDHIQEVARVCNAPALKFSGNKDDLADISNALLSLPAAAGSNVAMAKANRFQWFLLLGIALSIVSLVLIPVKRK